MESNEKIYEKVKTELMYTVANKILDEIISTNHFGLQRAIEELLNQVMISERQLYLKNNPGDKGNGFYPRNLAEGSFNLHLQVPRVRNGDFRPSILPEPYKRTGTSYIDLLGALVVNGYSPSQLRRTLRQLGLPYTDEDLQQIIEDLKQKLQDFKSRQLPEEVFALIIDGYHTEAKESSRVRKTCVYSVVGIDFQWKKDLYGVYEFFGSESKQGWLKVLNDLIHRGLKKVAIIVSDDFKGLREAIEELYPLTDHQLCFVHLQRNVRRQMGRGDSQEFLRQLKQIKEMESFEIARDRFIELCERYEKKYPYFMRLLKAKAENYLSFLKYPAEVRKYIYTTNIVENFNRRIEEIRQRLGGYFQSLEVLEINVLLQRERLLQGKWSKPIPALKAHEYELRQIFRSKFSEQTQDS